MLGDANGDPDCSSRTVTGDIDVRKSVLLALVSSVKSVVLDVTELVISAVKIESAVDRVE